MGLRLREDSDQSFVLLFVCSETQVSLKQAQIASLFVFTELYLHVHI